MNTEDRLKKLEEEVRELTLWKTDRQRQQLTYPLDVISKDVIANYFLKIENQINFIRTNGREVPLYIIGKANNILYTFTANPTPYIFTAATSDVITSSAGFDFENDMTLQVFTDQVLPAGLLSDTLYYVINASGKTCKLSLTSGGAAIDITDTGTGNHYFQFI